MSKKYNEIEVKNNMKIEEEQNTETVDSSREKKDLKSVVTEKPTKVKRGLLSRLITGVVGPEGLPGIGAYVNEEIIKPAVKNIIVDAVTSGINMVMYGEKGGPNKHRYGSSARPTGGGYRPSTNYGSSYRSAPPEPAGPDKVLARSARYGVEEYIIGDRYDVSHVITTLTELADRYDSVSVADYYDLIGVPSQYTDNNYGWTIDSITKATIVPVRGGYVIRFPQVEVI